MGATSRRAVQRGAGGFSLVEMMVAMVVAVIVGTGLYFVFSTQQRASRSQKVYNDLQANCSFALGTMKNELLLAGYDAKNALEPISGPGATAITFEYLDDNAPDIQTADDPMAAVFTRHTQVSYSLVGTDLTKTVRRWRTDMGSYEVPLNWGAAGANSVTIAENIPSLGFTYFKEDNQPWSTGEVKSLIRTVRVSLQCRAAQADALDMTNPTYQVVALTAEVRPRNIAVSDNPEDRTPPAVPVSNPGDVFNVWDAGQCGCLNLAWTSNTDSDIAGYTIYYGLAAGAYTGRIRVVHQSGALQSASLRDLSAANAPYFVAIAAYDRSGNQSALSTAVSANPVPSVRVAGAGNDTAITPLPPPAPGSPAIATPADNELLVSWASTYSDCLTTPVHGYRVYRSTSPDFVPEGASEGNGNCVADEGTLGPTATSYRDVGQYFTVNGQLVGCETYYYKIAVVTCDPAQLTAYTDGDAGTASTYTAAQFAAISGSPTDGTAPGNVSHRPTLTSQAGYRRIILSITNPVRTGSGPAVDPDFDFTRIFFSTVGYPVLSETRDAEGYNIVTDPGGGAARLVPDRGGSVVDGGGPHTINFDDENSEVPPGGIGDPQLNRDETYYFLAVAYDLCKNHNEDLEQARSTADQCNDCLATEGCRDAPPAPENVRVTQGCDGALQIAWDYPDAYYISHPDFQGFRVVRCEGAGCVPLDPILGGTGTVIGGTYLSPDKFLLDDTVVDGRVYNYRVYAGDCYYQRWLEGLPLDAANDPANNAASANLSGVSLGYFDRAQVAGIDSETRLTAGIDAFTSVIPVVSTAGWTHRRLLINAEVIECNGLTPTSFTDCWWRGAEGTVNVPHLAGTPVRSFPPAPPRAAVTGDLSLVPPTFLHNSIVVGARNTSAGSLTLNGLEASWEDAGAWLTSLLYDGSATIFAEATPPYTHGAGGSTITLTPTTVAALEDNVPLTFTFLKADGTADASIDLRNDQARLTWGYRNNATGIDTCSRQWWPPAPEGIVAPPGPTIGGTTQSSPTFGTPAWPVPGASGANPLNAVIAPANGWNQVVTNVHDTSGTGIATVRLYYTSTDLATTTPPAVNGAYPGCVPYSVVEMSSLGGETWGASLPQWPTEPSAHNNRNVWYFIVAVDNEGNFDRAPEVGDGFFQYFQQPEDPCLNTPLAPELVGVADASSVTLDWAASWQPWEPYPYLNTNGTTCTDLAGFRIFQRIGGGGWSEVAGSPFPPTTKTFTRNFATATATLSAAVTDAETVLPVGGTGGFRPAGKVKVGDEIISYAAITPTSFTGCTRGGSGTAAAAHAAGDAVTQDLLELEANSFFVRAYDTCPSGAKFSDSTIFTEGRCAPQCRFSVWPAGWGIQPGGSFGVDIQACEKAGNGVQDTIYVQVCSSVEGDEVALLEDVSDSGYFWGNIGTQLGSVAAGGNTVVVVAEDDTITIGGYASAAGTWPDVNVCAASYFCGTSRTIDVFTPGADICADDHTPPVPAGAAPALLAGDGCSGSGTSSMTLSWTKVAPPPDCAGGITYRGYQCEGAGCTPDLAISGFFTSEAANCSATSCTSNVINVAPAKISNKVYRFAVSAVCQIDTCTAWDGSAYTQTWESLLGSTTGDACPP